MNEGGPTVSPSPRAARSSAAVMYSTSICGSSRTPAVLRALAQTGTRRVDRSPSARRQDQRRLGERLDRHRLDHPLGVGGHVEQLLARRTGWTSSPRSSTGRTQPGLELRRRGRRRRPRPSSDRSTRTRTPGCLARNPGHEPAEQRVVRAAEVPNATVPPVERRAPRARTPAPPAPPPARVPRGAGAAARPRSAGRPCRRGRTAARPARPRAGGSAPTCSAAPSVSA